MFRDVRYHSMKNGLKIAFLKIARLKIARVKIERLLLLCLACWAVAGNVTPGLLARETGSQKEVGLQKEGAPQKPGSGNPSAGELFATVPFEDWVQQGPRQQLPWKVRLDPGKLSFHQRLMPSIEVEVPGSELARRRNDGQLVMLVEVSSQDGHNRRDYSVFDLGNMKPEMAKSDVQFVWQAFAVPGEYDVKVALYDKASGERNFARSKLRVEGLKNDPLPDAWKGLTSWEFLASMEEGVDSFYRPEIAGQLRLPLASRRPLQLEVLADLTPSDLFHGSPTLYDKYLSGALPLFKTLSQLGPANGSLNVAAMDLTQRRVIFSQENAKALAWERLRTGLSPRSGPGMVDVRSVKHGAQSPAFLREEIVRRIEKKSADANHTLQVFVIVGSAMDTYSFSDLPPIALEAGKEKDCVVYYLQYLPFNYLEPEEVAPAAPGPPGYQRYPGQQRRRPLMPRTGLTGAGGNIQKMLKPLDVRIIQVRNPEEARRALARILEELGQS